MTIKDEVQFLPDDVNERCRYCNVFGGQYHDILCPEIKKSGVTSMADVPVASGEDAGSNPALRSKDNV